MTAKNHSHSSYNNNNNNINNKYHPQSNNSYNNQNSRKNNSNSSNPNNSRMMSSMSQQTQQQAKLNSPPSKTPIILSDIMSPREALELLGVRESRAVLRGYRRMILSSSVLPQQQQRSNAFHNNGNGEDDDYYSDYGSDNDDDNEYDDGDLDEGEDDSVENSMSNNDGQDNMKEKSQHTDDDVDDIEYIFETFDENETQELDQVMKFLLSIKNNENETDSTSKIRFPTQHQNYEDVIITPQNKLPSWFSHKNGILKQAFPKLVLPSHIFPPSGVMDCIFAALTNPTGSNGNNSTAVTQNQQQQQQQQSNNNPQQQNASQQQQQQQTQPVAKQLHYFTLIIFLATLRKGTFPQKASMSFRVYDSFQRKTFLPRETLQKFISVIYGNEYLEKAGDTLDRMFRTAALNNASSSQQQQQQQINGNKSESTRSIPRILNADQFLKAMISTSVPAITSSSSMIKENNKSLPYSHHVLHQPSSIDAASNKQTHILTLWLEALSHPMIPVSTSFKQYPKILKMDMRDIGFSSSNSSYAQNMLYKKQNSRNRKKLLRNNYILKNLYQQFNMTRLMQYECRRKFHSICQYNNSNSPHQNSLKVIQQGNTTTADEEETAPSSTSASPTNNDKAVPSSSSPNDDVNNKKSSPSHHSIHESSFYSAISDINEETTSNGFLPRPLAHLLFQFHLSVSRSNITNSNKRKKQHHQEQKSSEQEKQSPAQQQSKSQPKHLSSSSKSVSSCWSLSDATYFSCLVLRSSLMKTKNNETTNIKQQHHQEKDKDHETDSAIDEEEKQHEDELLRYLYKMFLFTKDSNSTVSSDSSSNIQNNFVKSLLLSGQTSEQYHEFPFANPSRSENKDTSSKETIDIMDQEILQNLILAILDHAAFRKSRDSLVCNYYDDDNDTMKQMKYKKYWWLDEKKQPSTKQSPAIMVDIEASIQCGLLPKDCPIDSEGEPTVPIKALLRYLWDSVKMRSKNDYTDDTVHDDGRKECKIQLSLQDFLNWHYRDTRILNPLLLELKLIAGVIFGVKPSSHKSEFLIVEEMKRRFLCNHPQSSKNPRGPPGTTWYVVSTPWWKHWSEYSCGDILAGHQRKMKKKPSSTNLQRNNSHTQLNLPGRAVLMARSSPPGEINNNALLLPGSLALKKSLMWRADFELIPPLAWQALQAWHDGGPPISRTVSKRTSTNKIASGSSSQQKPEAEIEIYPLFLNIALADSVTGQPRPFQQCVPVSRHQPVHMLVKSLCKSLKAQYTSLRQQQTTTTKETHSSQNEFQDFARLWMIGSNKKMNSQTSNMNVTTNATHQQNSSSNSNNSNDPSNHSDVRLLDLDLSLSEQNVTAASTNYSSITDTANTSSSMATSSTTSTSTIGNSVTVGNNPNYGYNSNTMLLLELKNDRGIWPRGEASGLERDQELNSGANNVKGGVTTNKNTSNSTALTSQNPVPQVGDGIVGLYNMGNTCYLNSSIQCLSHTPLLRQYFTSKAYLKDINTTNIFGHQGRLAQVCAVLINQLWKHHPKPMNNNNNLVKPIGIQNNANYTNSTTSTSPIQCPSVTPKTFKDAIGKMNDHFLGNEQHDAQELLSYLLAGLSEDLNRIESKPYIEQPDSDGSRNDHELADIWWKNHLKREMSIIVALFSGQFKSLLTCKVCGYESARFEPFMYLQLPLPNDDLVTLTIVYFPLNHKEKVLKYSVRTKQDGIVRDILIEFAKILYKDRRSNAIDSSSSHDEELDEEDEEESEDSNSSDNMNKKPTLDRRISAIADNLAVAEVRECQVRSITPPTRSLAEMQSRDTGEVPAIFVYELDPLHQQQISKPSPATNNDSEMTNEAKKNEADTPEKPTKTNEAPDTMKMKAAPVSPPCRPSYIAVAQRKVEAIPNNPFMHHLLLRTFDVPLLLRISDMEGYTGSDLYDFISKRVSRFVPGGSVENLVKLARKLEKQKQGKRNNSIISNIYSGGGRNIIGEEEEEEKKEQTKSSKRQPTQITTIDMETVSGGDIPRCGFRIRLTTRDCKRCSRSLWFDCSIGCVIPDDDFPTIVQDGDSIALDWHMGVYTALRDQKDLHEKSSNVEVVQDRHEKLKKNKVAQSIIRTQVQLLDRIEKHRTCRTENSHGGSSITLEECMDSFAKEERIPEAYCSKCKDHVVSTKGLSIWRLPPVLIIHLKRFQFTEHMRRKLRNLVVFPTEGLDLSRIVASSSQQEQNQEDSKKHGTKMNGNMMSQEEEEDDKCSNLSGKKKHQQVNESTLYDLYGVVHHQGALSTGHYVASLRSENDDKWRLFNDAQVYEVDGKDIVDSSAYILFYIRKDAKTSELSDFWDVSSRDGEGLTEEEVDKLTKPTSSRDRCSIS